MTAQEVIENVLLLSRDTDAVGHTEVEVLAHLRKFVRLMYEFVIRWRLTGVSGFETTEGTLTPDSDTGLAALPSDFYALYSVITGSGESTFRTSLRAIKKYKAEGRYPASTLVAFSGSDLLIYPASDCTLIYYPTLAALDLISEMPANGALDNAAIDWLIAQLALTDRFSGVDVRLEFMNSDRALQAARHALLRFAPSDKRLPVGGWSYEAANAVSRFDY